VPLGELGMVVASRHLHDLLRIVPGRALGDEAGEETLEGTLVLVVGHEPDADAKTVPRLIHPSGSRWGIRKPNI